MIDVDNYKRAIRWLRRGLAQLDRFENAPQLLSRFAHDLESFVHCLEKRLATNA